MIAEALDCVRESLNDFIKMRFPGMEDKVVLSSLVNQDGSVAIGGENKLALTLVGIEPEIASLNTNTFSGGFTGKKSAPVTVNLIVMVSAYFSNTNYLEALRFLSIAIGFFQDKNVFTSDNTPNMSPMINKLTFEIENCSFEKMSNIYSTQGAKYIPGLLYRVRMLTFTSDFIKEYRPRITGLDNNNI